MAADRDSDGDPASGPVPEATRSPAVTLWTDGSCAPNPGPGGWAALLIRDTDEEMLSGGEDHTTNNRMELTAVIMGLRTLPSASTVVVKPDSTYVASGYGDQLTAWRGRAVDGVWRTASKKPLPNQDLWEELVAEVDRHALVEWHPIPGHSGIPENDRVDAEAVDQRKVSALRVAAAAHTDPA